MWGMAAKTSQLFTCDWEGGGGGVNMFTHLSVWVYTTETLTLLHLIPVYVLRTATYTVSINGVRKQTPGWSSLQLMPLQKARLHVSAQDTKPKATSNIRRQCYGWRGAMTQWCVLLSKYIYVVLFRLLIYLDWNRELKIMSFCVNQLPSSWVEVIKYVR